MYYYCIVSVCLTIKSCNSSGSGQKIVITVELFIKQCLTKDHVVIIPVSKQLKGGFSNKTSTILNSFLPLYIKCSNF